MMPMMDPGQGAHPPGQAMPLEGGGPEMEILSYLQQLPRDELELVALELLMTMQGDMQQGAMPQEPMPMM